MWCDRFARVVVAKESADVGSGLQVVGGSDSSIYDDVVTPGAAEFIVSVWKRVQKESSFVTLLQKRTQRHEFVSDMVGRAGVEAIAGVKCEGVVLVGARDDETCVKLRSDADWSTQKIPLSLDHYHDTLVGKPSQEFFHSLASNTASMVAADFHGTVAHSLVQLCDAVRSIKAFVQKAATENNRKKGKRNKNKSTTAVHSSNKNNIVLRCDDVSVPSLHFLYENVPIPLHIVEIALYLHHCWESTVRAGQVPVIQVPKIETFEEGQYFATLLNIVDLYLEDHYNHYVKGSFSCIFDVDSPFAAFQCEEIMYALRDYLVGVSVDWNGYHVAVLDIYKDLATFDSFYFGGPLRHNRTMAKVEDLVVSLCRKRGAIPIGGHFNIVKHEDGRDVIEAHASFVKELLDKGFRGMWFHEPSAAAAVGKTIQQYSSATRKTEETKEGNDDNNDTTDSQLSVLALIPFREAEEPLAASIVEQTISHTAQLLASYIFRVGAIAITSNTVVAHPFTFFASSSYLEMCWRELRNCVLHCRTVRITQSGKEEVVPISVNLMKVAIQRVKIRIFNQGAASFKRTGKNKIAYDAAFRVLERLIVPTSLERLQNSMQETEHEVKQEDEDEEGDEVGSMRNAVEHIAKYLVLPFIDQPAALERYEALSKYPFLAGENIAPQCKIEFVTNDAFASASNLLKPDFPIFEPHSFCNKGQVYDGWESARHNISPPDYAIVWLPSPTVIAGVNIDTAHFDGNHAIGTRLEGLVVERLDRQRRALKWVEIVPKSLTQPNARHFFASESNERVQKLRLSMYPDGGIARLEIYAKKEESGEEKKANQSREPTARERIFISTVSPFTGFPEGFQPDPSVEICESSADPDVKTDDIPKSMFTFPADLSDLACKTNGGIVIASSSAHYSNPANIIKPGRGFNMGDGWETKRLRPDPPSDVFDMEEPVHSFNWTVIALAQPGVVKNIVLDTLHFRNNPPVCAAVEGCYCPDMNAHNYYASHVHWHSLVKKTYTHPHDEQSIAVNMKQPITHVLLKIFPCGGMSRLRVMATPYDTSKNPEPDHDFQILTKKKHKVRERVCADPEKQPNCIVS